jgi:hypothetical protein
VHQVKGKEILKESNQEQMAIHYELNPPEEVLAVFECHLNHMRILPMDELLLKTTGEYVTPSNDMPALPNFPFFQPTFAAIQQLVQLSKEKLANLKSEAGMDNDKGKEKEDKFTTLKIRDLQKSENVLIDQNELLATVQEEMLKDPYLRVLSELNLDLHQKLQTRYIEDAINAYVFVLFILHLTLYTYQ